MSVKHFPEPLESSAAIFRIWRIDDQIRLLLDAARPTITRALTSFASRATKVSGARATIAAIATDPARAELVDHLRAHWFEIFDEGPTEMSLARAVEIGRRKADLAVRPRHYLALCQLVSKIITDVLIEDPNIDTPHAIDAVGRVIMMDAEVVLAAYYGRLAERADSAARSETRSLRDRVTTLEGLAFIDGLTGLFNRRYFDLSIGIEIARADREQKPLSLLICDLDRFKQINDSWGHQMGDQALRQAAEALMAVGRKTDVLTRFGGDEFCFLLPNTKPQWAIVVAERVRSLIAATEIETERGQRFTLTASVGVGSYHPGDSAAQLLERADRALYRAKGDGRNRVTDDAGVKTGV